MNIYPKTCRNFNGIETLMPYVEKYKGIELQFFDENGTMAPFDFKTIVEKLLERVPYLKEITIHPPLSHYDIECIIAKDMDMLKGQFEDLVYLSRKYNVKINMVYHTLVDFPTHKELTLDKISELLKIIEGENVNLLLENIYMFFEKKCTVYQIAEYFNHPNLGVCLDVCHLHCRANIDKIDINEYLKNYLDPKLCEKYTYQVHFSYTANNDGYVDHKTHGIAHPNIDELRKDIKILKDFGITKNNSNFVTEVAESDYSSRHEQYRELEMLEQVLNEEE